MKLGVVGGSSLVSFDPTDEFAAIGLTISSKKDITVETPHGKVRLRIVELTGAASHTIVFVQRHNHDSAGMTPPHAINYHANMRALADQGVDGIVATTSVGTILATFPPGRVGVCRQYIDFTGVATTYHHDDAKFTSVTQPFDERLNAQLLETLRRVQGLGADTRLEYTAFLMVGPQYETEAEINAIERLGGEVVGMTMPREAKLCAELGVPYAALLIATNWAAGRHPGDPSMALKHEEVSEMSARVTGTIIKCLIDLLKNGLPMSGRTSPPSPSKKRTASDTPTSASKKAKASPKH